MGDQHKEVFVKPGEGTLGDMECDCSQGADHTTIMDLGEE